MLFEEAGTATPCTLADSWEAALPAPSPFETGLLELITSVDLSSTDSSKWDEAVQYIAEALDLEDWHRVGGVGLTIQKQMTNRIKQRGVVGVEVNLFVVADPRLFAQVCSELQRLIADPNSPLTQALIAVCTRSGAYRIARVLDAGEG